VTAVVDPDHYLTVPGIAAGQPLALFRRPLPSTNLRFLSAVMWDGR
jgi:cytochrome c peroxidase